LAPEAGVRRRRRFAPQEVIGRYVEGDLARVVGDLRIGERKDRLMRALRFIETIW
jgi:hypothetical protein